MSIREAAQLVLQAGSMGHGGEIFVLDMGEPVRIADLARDMIRLSGHSESDIRIVFSGLRPGEKLYEELLADSSSPAPPITPSCASPAPSRHRRLARRPAGLAAPASGGRRGRSAARAAPLGARVRPGPSPQLKAVDATARA
jgi:hypothetical protein